MPETDIEQPECAPARPPITKDDARLIAKAVLAQDNQSKAYLNQCIVAGQVSKSWPLGLWLDVNGNPVSPVTYADLENLAVAMEAAEVPEYQDLLTKIAAVQAATTVEAVQAITF